MNKFLLAFMLIVFCLSFTFAETIQVPENFHNIVFGIDSVKFSTDGTSGSTTTNDTTYVRVIRLGYQGHFGISDSIGMGLKSLLGLSLASDYYQSSNGTITNSNEGVGSFGDQFHLSTFIGPSFKIVNGFP